MKDITLFILAVIENIENIFSNEVFKYKAKIHDILSYIEPFSLYLVKNSLEYEFYILNLLDDLIDSNILNKEKNTICINKNHEKYIKYKEDYEINKEKNNNNLTILFYASKNKNILFQNKNKELDTEDSDTEDSDIQKSYIEKSDYQDSTIEYIENKYYVKSESSNVKYVIDNNMTHCSCKSFEFCKLNPKICKHLEKIKKDKYEFIEEKSSDDSLDYDSPIEMEEKKYILPSFTYEEDNYYINISLTECSCKSFEYCKSNPKTCKHLEHLKTNKNILKDLDTI
jgi:predicted nucleic acid-binding Zn finger protein